jgi:hypothetical protein
MHGPSRYRMKHVRLIWNPLPFPDVSDGRKWMHTRAVTSCAKFGMCVIFSVLTGIIPRETWQPIQLRPFILPVLTAHITTLPAHLLFSSFLFHLHNINLQRKQNTLHLLPFNNQASAETSSCIESLVQSSFCNQLQSQNLPASSSSSSFDFGNNNTNTTIQQAQARSICSCLS